jgi:hypothetical protein
LAASTETFAAVRPGLYGFSTAARESRTGDRGTSARRCRQPPYSGRAAALTRSGREESER